MELHPRGKRRVPPGKSPCSQAQHDPPHTLLYPFRAAPSFLETNVLGISTGSFLQVWKGLNREVLLPIRSEPAIFVIRRFLPDGKVFDASNAPGRKPIAFKLGARQVIKGWEEVLRLMNVRRTTRAVFCAWPFQAETQETASKPPVSFLQTMTSRCLRVAFLWCF